MLREHDWRMSRLVIIVLRIVVRAFVFRGMNNTRRKRTGECAGLVIFGATQESQTRSPIARREVRSRAAVLMPATSR
jgi:hypothetical protein